MTILVLTFKISPFGRKIDLSDDCLQVKEIRPDFLESVHSKGDVFDQFFCIAR